MGIRSVLLFCAACLAIAATPVLAQSVGVAAAVNQSALGTPPSDKPRTMVLGDKVIHNEKIETNGQGLLQILLADGTSFTVGPNSSMAIDSFVYDPSAGTAKVVATLGKGVFRFIGGKTSKSPDGAVLNTPVGTVGIRGGIGDFDFHGGKGIPIHIDMLFGDSITLTNHGSLIGRIFQPGFSIAFGPNNQIGIQKTPAAWTANFQHNVSGNGSQHGGTPGGHTISTAIANALGTPNGGNPKTPPGTTPATTTVADFIQPPPVPFTAPDMNSGDATWAEINNSSLAGVNATYLGDYALTMSVDNPPPGAQDLSQTLDGNFSLAYYFGRQNGGGLLSFNSPTGEGSPLVLPVLPNEPTGLGQAAFGAHFATLPGDVNGDDDEAVNLDVAGKFLNTDAGIAGGVTGNFNFNASVPLLDDNDVVLPGNTGISVNGAFNGSLDHTSKP